jgi:hypothetical protein
MRRRQFIALLGSDFSTPEQNGAEGESFLVGGPREAKWQVLDSFCRSAGRCGADRDTILLI